MGGGLQTPGFIGHSKQYIGSNKFISAEGGILRLVWMHTSLKEQMRDIINRQAAKLGVENFLDLVADETHGASEEEAFEFINSVNHPALSMPPLF